MDNNQWKIIEDQLPTISFIELTDKLYCQKTRRRKGIVPAPSAVVTVVSISIFTGSANRRTDLLDAMEYETPRHGCAINCILDGKARCDLCSHSSPLRVAVPTDDVVGCGKLRETIAVDYTLSSSSLSLLLQQGIMQTPCVRNQGALCEWVIVMDILLSFPHLARKIKTS